MIADINSLVENDIFLEVEELTDVNGLKTPSKFIEEYSKGEFNSKNPLFVKNIISILDHSIMRKNSKTKKKTNVTILSRSNESKRVKAGLKQYINDDF